MHHAEHAARAQGTAFVQRVLVVAGTVFPARILLFLVLFLWHVLVTVDPRCVFFAQNDLFLWNWRFFRDYLLVPGGVAEWTGGLVLQFCHFGWPGALILAGVAWLLCIGTVGFLNCLSPTDAGIAWTVPATVLLVAHSQYDFAFSVSIGAALAMWSAFGYAGASARCGPWRVLWFAGLCTFLYYLAGAALWVFALCSMIYDFYRPGGRLTKLALVVVALAARFVVDGVLASFPSGLSDLRIPISIPFREELSLTKAAMAFYASFPLCALALADRAARRQREHRAKAGAERRRDGHPDSAPLSAPVRWVAATVLFLVCAAAAGRLAHLRGVRTVLALHESADHERWNEVLHLAADVPSELYSQYVTHDVNQALYHTGRMAFDMFSYPQLAEPFVIPSRSDPYALLLRRLAEFHMQLGRVNDAEYHAHENLVARPSAECFRQLARIAIVKGRVEAARLFLNVLRDDLVYGAWAEKHLGCLQDDPTLSRDAEVARIRALMIEEDHLHYAVAPPTTDILSVSKEGQMSSLLRQNPLNQMAFEYAMARYLIIGDVETVVRLLPKAAQFAYAGTPTLYEEAAMIYARIRGEEMEASRLGVVVNGCRISEQTLGKIRKLDATVVSGRSDPAEVARVAGNLGLAYFRYYYSRRAGP